MRHRASPFRLPLRLPMPRRSSRPRGATRRSSPRGRRRRSLPVRLLRGAVVTLVAIYALAALALLVVRVVPPPTTMVRVQRWVEARLAGRAYDERQAWRDLASLPRHVPRAVVAAEDARFYEHAGFDWAEFEAAGREAERTGKPRRGASTITQQLVKNLFLTTHRSVLRKGAEVALTPLAELILPKERILELYLNEIEWGPGVFGVEAAARHHYRVAATRLTRAQATRLAAVIPAPRTRLPARMGWYARVIDGRMRAMGW